MSRRPVRLALVTAFALLVPLVGASPSSGIVFPDGDDAPVLINPKGEVAEEISEAEESGDFAKLRDAYYTTRLLAGDRPTSIEQAAKLRRKAIATAATLPTIKSTTAASTVGGSWTSVGPDPSVQIGRTSNTRQAVSGRIGALAVKGNGDILAGAAQGGVWLYHQDTGQWTSQSDAMATQAVGALAIAPSDGDVVYLGSGEGALSGDSYYGDGVYRSDDGGLTWDHVSGSFFQGASTSDIVVDPANADHVYIATLRGRGGIRRTTPPSSQPYGIWESTDGGASWKLLKGTTNEFRGATDLVMDPLQPRILWASFWGDGIYRSQNGGKSWGNAMGNLPQGLFADGGTRFSLGIAHLPGQYPVLYTGTDYFDKKGNRHLSSVWRNDSGGLAWKPVSTGGPTSNPDSILDYCTTQCSYDNVVMPDPTNPDIVYVAGSYGYDQSPQSGGIYRSMDGGQTWKSLGYDLHPDFHALAFDPNDSKHIVVGNDGGVWQSPNRGGRLADGAPLSAANWENLNGQVNPATGGLLHSTGLRITQFTSIATVPNLANTYWGGTQDNGTQRKSTAGGAAGFRWFDQPSGDGGQVIVDQDTLNTEPQLGGFPAWVFGTYFGISPYRFSPQNIGFFAGNELIDGGINTKDRAEFYVPWVMNRDNTNQMFLGTYRLYRTNNAETPSAGDVHWDPISPDLTTGCPGTAPNGARGCFISAIGLADGGDAVYTGSDDGKLFVNPHAVSAADPSAGWKDITASNLPNRPVSQFAVDRSNWRIAYVSFTGFRANTPTNPASVFKTTDGGQTWQDITSNLPDSPVNSIVLDPAFTNTLYAGTDIGVFVSTNDGGSWDRLGTGMPKISTWQLDFDATHRLLAAGTHGRGAYTIGDSASAPAFVVSTVDAGKPVGPGKALDYTITLRNRGNADATGVTVTDPLPDHTTFASASDGGTSDGSAVTWSGVSVPAGGLVRLHLSVTIDESLPAGVTEIVNDGLTVSDGDFGTTGSPHTTVIAPAYDVSVTPASQKGGGRPGTTVDHHVTVSNNGYQDDAYAVTATSTPTWPTEVRDATCSTVVSAPVPVASGTSADLCIRVTVPADAANAATSDTAVTATSTGNTSVSGSATATTIAVTVDTLLVDNDNNDPDVAGTYAAALTAAGEQFDTWDLSEDPTLPTSYLLAHKHVVWFTGNSYPAPITPYEDELAAFLDGGGHLLMSGQDILDQAAGTTAFVHDYLHIDWDGSEAQNDKATPSVSGVTGNPVTGAIGTVPLDHSVLGATFEDELTPVGLATAAFTGQGGNTYGLTVADSGYKVEFLGFPLEAYGDAAAKAALVTATYTWFRS